MHVVDDVIELDTETDHRGFVRDRIDVAHRSRDNLGVGDVPPAVLRASVAPLRRSLVGGRQQRIEHAYVVAVGDQRIDDVRADEPGASCDEHAHQTRTRGSRIVNTAPPLSFATSRRPLWASTNPFAIARPSPAPAPGVRARSPWNATSKMRPMSSLGTPPPLSRTATYAYSGTSLSIPASTITDASLGV